MSGSGTRFRVVVPVRDAERWVGRCVASIRRQRGGDLRCLVLDDRSSDGTAEAARRAAEGDARFEVVVAPERDDECPNWLPINPDAVSYTHLTLPTNREV